MLIFEATTNQLIEVKENANGNLNKGAVIYHNIQHFGLGNVQGMAINPTNGQLFILDVGNTQIVIVEPQANGRFRQAQLSYIDLQYSDITAPQGIAFNPNNEHLYVISLEQQLLYELSLEGQVAASYDLSTFNLSDPQGMVFAPSGDLTDDPEQLSLYLTDSGEAISSNQDNNAIEEEGDQLINIERSTTHSESGQIMELSFAEIPSPNLAAVGASLVQTVDTSLFSPPSPDPAGITYLPASDTLLISDSEVNEIPALFTGDNLFEMDRFGALSDTLTTISFSDEPTGVTVNPANGHLFFSDDTQIGSIYELNPGPDGLYDTPDDILTSFSTEDFGANDPEGVTFDSTNGVLFIADGVNHEIYRVDPGSNGIFDGVAPVGDDQVTNFNTTSLGFTDPEGIAYDSEHDALYMIGEPITTLAHVTTEGTLIRLIDISVAGPIDPGGLAYAPSSLVPGEMNIYVADRGIDNDIDPLENDGIVFELSIPPLANVAPEVDASLDQTITLPNGAVLDGTLVEDDGNPMPAVTTWRQISGPGSVSFADANALDTTADFTLPGTYVLRLEADDGELTDSDDVTIDVTGEADVAFLDVAIAGTDPADPTQSSDDAEEVDNETSSLSRFSTDLDMLYDRSLDRDNKMVGLRFNSINIPPGSIITNAFVQFHVDEASSDAASFVIQGEAADNPVTFSFGDKIASRPPTASQVAWSPAPWTTVGEATADQRTPNLAPIIQEIVDRSGWVDGNSIAILISGVGERTAVAFEGDPAQAPSLHVEYITQPPFLLEPTIGEVANLGSNWQTITLNKSYDDMVVVASLEYGLGQPPAVVRIRNANGNSFEIQAQNPSGQALSGYIAHYLVVEAGTYTVAKHGVNMEAVKVLSTQTDRKGSWLGEQQSYLNTYSNPVVIGQVMSANDADWSSFWARGSSAQAPPNATNFHVGKHVGEDIDITRADETIAYIVIEAGSGVMNDLSYEAAVGADIVRGPSNSPPVHLCAEYPARGSRRFYGSYGWW